MIKSNNTNYSSFLYESSLAPLDAKTERELVLRMYQGDKEARETLIRSNIRFAIRTAGKYSGYINHRLDRDDLNAIAVVGLIRGVDHYDMNRNSRVITCVSWWIRDEFKKLAAKNDEEEIPQSSTEAMETFLMNLSDEESLSPEESAINSCFRDTFYKKMKELKSDERAVLVLHNGLCGNDKLNYEEIGARYGKTKQWAWLKTQSAEQRMLRLMNDWLA